MLVSSDFEIVPVQVPKKKHGLPRAIITTKNFVLQAELMSHYIETLSLIQEKTWDGGTRHYQPPPIIPGFFSPPPRMPSKACWNSSQPLEMKLQPRTRIYMYKNIYILYKYISSYITVFFDSNLIYLYIDLICILHIAFTK